MNYDPRIIQRPHSYHTKIFFLCRVQVTPQTVSCISTVYHSDVHPGLHLAGSVCLQRHPGLLLIQHGADLPQHQHPG